MGARPEKKQGGRRTMDKENKNLNLGDDNLGNLKDNPLPSLGDQGPSVPPADLPSPEEPPSFEDETTVGALRLLTKEIAAMKKTLNEFCVRFDKYSKAGKF